MGRVWSNFEPKVAFNSLYSTLVVDEDDLQRCLQTETLNIVTDEAPQVVGSMCVRVAMRSETRGPPTLVVRVESTGKISGSPCGTVIDARLSMRLETLEQRHQEFVKVRRLQPSF